MLYLALLWCLANPRVSTVILGAPRESQLIDTPLDSRDKLTPDVLAEIEAGSGSAAAASDGRAVLGSTTWCLGAWRSARGLG